MSFLIAAVVPSLDISKEKRFWRLYCIDSAWDISQVNSILCIEDKLSPDQSICSQTDKEISICKSLPLIFCIIIYNNKVQ